MEKREKGGKLPRKLLHFTSPDKNSLDRHWYPGRDPLNLVHCRCLIAGPPNSGKNLLLSNILCRTKYDQVVIWTFDPESKEFDSINHIRVQGPPPMELFDPSVRSCLILDDVDLSALKKDDQLYMNRVLGALSTHRNISCFVLCQDAISQVPSTMRRNFNIFFLYKGCDLRAMEVINARVNLPKGSLQNAFKFLAPSDGQSIRIDMTKNSPIPLGIDAYTKIAPIEY